MPIAVLSEQQRIPLRSSLSETPPDRAFHPRPRLSYRSKLFLLKPQITTARPAGHAFLPAPRLPPLAHHCSDQRFGDREHHESQPNRRFRELPDRRWPSTTRSALFGLNLLGLGRYTTTSLLG